MDANTISFNDGDGVLIGRNAFQTASILGNAIFSNGGLGIDLQGGEENASGVTANDVNDEDEGANRLQNYPFLSRASIGQGIVTVDGFLFSTPLASFTIEFFSNADADPSSFGEGEAFLGSLMVTTDEAGDASFTFEADRGLPNNVAITATATQLGRSGGATSEFSPAIRLFDPFQVTTLNDDDNPEDGLVSLREAILAANENPGLDTITFAIPGQDGSVRTIRVGANGGGPLPVITDRVVIDGYTQSGTSPNTLLNGDNAILLIELSGASAAPGANGLSLTAGASGSTIRGLVINRFQGNGILLNASDANTIAGNFIGTDPTGQIDLGNNGIGIESAFFTNSDNNVIGGFNLADRNIISGNGGSGIEFTTSAGNAIRGNFIGIGADGSTLIGNGGSGIVFGSFSNGFVIGGANGPVFEFEGAIAGTARNIISGNAQSGIFLGGSGFGGGIVQGNYIGTDATGTLARPNLNGIDTNIANNTTIGGNSAGAGNLISGNTNQGIAIANTTNFLVLGNSIGVSATGGNLGNGGNGILFNANPSNVQIGGVEPGAGNTIMFNRGDGVQISSGTGNSVRGNSIFANGSTPFHLGIDLGPDGVTPNDAGDADTGANDLQNFPVLTSAMRGTNNATLGGTLNSTPSTSFVVDFFSSSSAHASGFGEGASYLGSATVTTDANGNAPIAFTSAAPVAAGSVFTATATGPNGTSEFSQAITSPVNYVWDGSAGDQNWFTAANWTPEGVPGASDTAVLNINSTINLTAGATVGSYTQSNGTLRGVSLTLVNGGQFTNGTIDEMTINGDFTATAASFFSGGLTVVNGLTLNGTMTVGNASGSPFGIVRFDGTQTLDGDGTVVFANASTSNSVLASDGSVLTLGPEITVRGQTGYLGSNPTNSGGTTTGSVINQGTIDADVAGGVITVRSVAGENLNVMRASNGGTLTLNGASLANAGGLIEVDDASKLIIGARVTGGSVNSQAGAQISGAQITSAQTFTGTLDGVTINGDFTTVNIANQTNSGLDGLGVANGLTLNGTMTVGTSSGGLGIVRFNGTQTLSGNGAVVFASASTANGLLASNGSVLTLGRDITVGGQTGYLGSNPTLFNGTTTGTVVNQGLIEWTTGTDIRVPTTLTNSGSITIDAGGNMNLVGTLLGGIVTTQAGAQITGGTLNGVTVGGDFTTRTTNTAAGVTIVNGLTLTGTMTVGGSGNAFGIVRFNGTQTLGGNGAVVFASGNTSNTLLASNGSILTFGPNITVGGQTGYLGGNPFISGGNTTGSIVNQGTVTAEVGGSTITSPNSFQNFGSVAAAGGNLAFGTGFVQTSGTTTLAGGNISNSGTLLFNGGMLSGAGTITGSVNNQGATVAPGASPGILAISGNYTQGSGGTLAIEIGGTAPGTGFDRLAVGGTATLGGTLNAALINGFMPPSTAQFQVVTANSRSGTFATENLPSGFATQYNANGVTLVAPPLGPQTFIWDAGGGADTSWFNPLNWNFDNGVPGADDTAILNIASTINLPTSTSVGTFQQSTGTFTSPAGVVFTILDSFVWTGGTQSGAGTTISDGTLTLSGAGAKTLNGRTLVNDGTVNLSGGDLSATNATIINNGIFNATGAAGVPGSGSGGFTNSATGTLNKSGTGTSAFYIFSNAGTVNATGGTLSFPNGYTQTEGSTVLGGGSITGSFAFNFNGGELRGTGSIGTGATLVNNGAIIRPGGTGAAGTLTIAAAYNHNAGGRVEIEVGGTGIGQFDVLAVTGNAAIGGGAMDASFLPGFTPGSSDTFRVLTAASRSGQFQFVNGPLVAQYNPTNVTLFVQTPGLFNWDAGGLADTSWFNPSNWSPDGVPGSTDTAILGINATTTLPANQSIGTLLHQNPNAIFTIPAGSTLTVLTNFTWTAGTQNGQGAITVAPAATFSFPGTSGNNAFLTERTLNLQGSSTFSNPSSEVIVFSGGATINNSGNLEIRNQLLFNHSAGSNGFFNNLAGGTVRNTTDTTFITGTSVASTNAGILRAELGGLSFNGGLTQTAGSSQLAGGTIGVGGTFLLQGGELAGTGAFGGAVNNTGGVVRPGGTGATGTLTTNGTYRQFAGGTIELEVAGAGAGQFDVFAPQGNAFIDGTLNAALLAGFTPPTGSQFRVLDPGGSVSGTFAAVNSPLTVQYNPGDVTLLGPVGSPFVVTTTSDVVNANDNVVSLREAILSANSNPGTDTITFAIPGSGLQTIFLGSTLPTLTERVVIDGYSQPGASANTLTIGNNATLRVQLDSGGVASNGLILQGGLSTVRGVLFTNFSGGGLLLQGSGNHTIEGNWIGLDAAGNTANGGPGITISSSGNTIGGSTPAARNVIPGSAANGAIVMLSGTGNNIQGNYIGTNATGTAGVGSGGINLTNFSIVTDNVISGTRDLALIQTRDSTVQGNIFGLSADGSTALSNRGGGIFIDRAQNNLIGGTAAAERNLITSLTISGTSAGGGANTVQGNYFGLTGAGEAIPGLAVESAPAIAVNGGVGNFIGGPTPGAGNVIANHAIGIAISGENTIVQGNRIGTNAAGTISVGNSTGITISGGAGVRGNLIGGTTATESNLISGNAGDAVQAGAFGIVGINGIFGNRIGVAADGVTPLGNAGIGIRVGFDGQLIGGSNPGEGNLIAYNGGDGVRVTGGNGTTIRGNTFFSNGGLGINLGTDGVTANDPGDADTGPNGLQNFPDLASAVRSSSNGQVTTSISGNLNSSPNSSFAVEFFASSSGNNSGPAEGAIFLGSATVSTNAQGNATLVFSTTTTVPSGSVLTATATNLAQGNTSEFSAGLPVITSYVWDAGAGGDTGWFNPANWSPDGVPGAADSATLNTPARITLIGNIQVGTFTQREGVVEGDGNLAVLTSFTWSGGTQSGTGTTRLATDSVTSISGSDTKVIDGRNVENAGTITWSGTGDIALNAGVFTNLNGASFLITNDAAIADFDGSETVGNFVNAGLFRKSAGTRESSFGSLATAGTFTNTGIVQVQSGSFRFANPLNNSGGLQVQAGLLDINGGGTSSGTLVAAPGATVEFSGGNYTLTDGAFIGGRDGLARITGGTVAIAAGAAVLAVANVELVGGTLGGAGNFTLAGNSLWSGGTMEGTGTTMVFDGATLTISDAAAKTLSRTLNNSGTVRTSGAAALAAVLVNATGAINNAGLFDLASDMRFVGSSPGTFANLSTGTLLKSGGSLSSESVLNFPFTNAGIIDVRAGLNLDLNGAFTQTGGATILGSGSTLGFAATPDFRGGEVRGSGTLDGNVRNSGATFRPGGSGATGTLNVAANYTQGPGGTLAIEVGGTGSGQFDVLAIGGTPSLGGTLNVALLNGFLPAAGQAFRVLTSPGNPGTFPNITGQTTGLSQRADTSGLSLVRGASVTYTWDGSDSTDWFNPNNWTPAGVPGAADTAILTQIPASGQLTTTGQFATGGSLVGVGYDATQDRIWTYESFGSTLQSFSRSGTLLSSIPRPGGSGNDADIEFAPEALTLGTTTLPAGTLLFIDGEVGGAEIYAVDKDTGAVLASLSTAFGTSHVVGGSYHPGRNTFFLVADNVDPTPNRIAEIDPATGAILNSFSTAPFNVSFGDVEVNATTGNLLLVSSVENMVRELRPTGELVASYPLPAGVSALSGAGLDDLTGELVLSSTNGSVYRVSGFAGGAPNQPVLTTNASVNIFQQSGGNLGGDGTLTVSGNLTWTGGTMSGQGVTLITGTGAASNEASPLILNHRTLRLENGGSLAVSGGTSLTLTNGALVEVAGNLTFGGTATFRNGGGPASSFSVRGGGVLENSSTDAVTFEVPVTNAGRVAVNESSTIRFDSTYLQTFGTTSVTAGRLLFSTAGEFEGGVLTGNGTISGNVLNTGATVRPGGPGGIGSFSISGDYTQERNGTLEIDLGGRLQGQFDRLDIGGTARLDGELEVSTNNGFTPASGDLFLIVDAEGVLGRFSSESLPAGVAAGYTDSTVFLAAGEPVAPLTLTVTDSPDPVVEGRNLTYVFTVSNNGQNPLTGVSLNDILPQQLAFVSASSSQGTVTTTNDGSSGNALRVIGNLGTINPGQTATVTVIVMPLQDGTVSNFATVQGQSSVNGFLSNSVSETTEILATGLEIELVSGPTTARTGQQFAYEFLVKNDGPNTATGVRFSDLIPAGATFVSASTSQGTTSSNPEAVNVLIGTLASGESATVRVVLRAPGDPARLNNTATVSADTADENPADNTVSTRTFILRPGDLMVTTIGDNSADMLVSAIVGDGVAVSNISYRGNGVSAGTFTGGTGIIGFESGIILSTGSVRNVVGPNVEDGITRGNQLPGDADLDTLTASETQDATVLEFDFVPNNNVISFQYVFSSDEYNEFANSSFNDVFGFFLNGVNVARLPGTTTAVSINSVNGGNPFGTDARNSEFFINNDLNSGGGLINTEMDGFTVVFSVQAPVNPGQINHIKLAIADTGDENLDSNVFIRGGSFVDEVPEADLTVTLSDSPDPVTPGGTLTYVARVTNTGPTTATAVTLSDFLPENVTFVSASTSQGSVTAEGNNLTVNVGALNVGAFAEVTIMVTANGNSTITNSVSVSSDVRDTNANNNFSSVTTQISTMNDFVVRNTNDFGVGSLRQAILDANSQPGIQTITFNIPGSGIHRIAPGDVLPAITDPVVIDGFTQPGSSANTLAIGNDAVFSIVLDGTLSESGGDGLVIASGGTVVRGLSIVNFENDAIAMLGIGGNTISGNFLGIEPDGVTSGGNGGGISMVDAGLNLIGGLSPGDRNVIANNGVGVLILRSSGNVLQGNYIGTNAAGTDSAGNAGDGVSIFGASADTVIGGTFPGARNVISGNGNDAIFISDVGSDRTIIQGNYLGLDATGTTAIGNDNDAIFITLGASQTLIGGTTPSARNVISGNNGYGISFSRFRGESPSNSDVFGNFIGTDAIGTGAIANTAGGIYILNTDNIRVGSGALGSGNLISGNFGSGVEIRGAFATDNLVAGNLIGVNVTGGGALGNEGGGVAITNGASNNLVGLPSRPNIISGNDGNGIEISSSGTMNNLVQSNFIGVSLDGTRAVPNTGAGIAITQAASGNDIGGTARGNIIAGNLGDGVLLDGASGNVVRGNRIGNVGLESGFFPNGGAGVHVNGGSGNRIGSPALSELNTILGNTGPGILVEGTDTVASLRGNIIVGNGGLGIDLRGENDPANGVTLNDQGDLDVGPNGFLNFPTLTSVTRTENGSTFEYVVRGTYSGAPNTTVTIDLYANQASDASGFGEGEALIRTFTVTTDSAGQATFAESFNGSQFTMLGTPIGPVITSTATIGSGPMTATSEFSQAATVAGGVTASINNVKISEGNSGRELAIFTVRLSGPATLPVSIDFGTQDLQIPGAAKAGEDYIARSGTLLFAPGETEKSIVVQVLGDRRDEPAERFGVTLSNPVDVTLADAEGIGLIRDDDHRTFFVGAERGSRVQMRDARDGSLVREFFAFSPNFKGGIRVAAGDVNGDGVDDLIAGAGSSGGARVRVFDGADLADGKLYFAPQLQSLRQHLPRRRLRGGGRRERRQPRRHHRLAECGLELDGGRLCRLRQRIAKHQRTASGACQLPRFWPRNGRRARRDRRCEWRRLCRHHCGRWHRPDGARLRRTEYQRLHRPRGDPNR